MEYVVLGVRRFQFDRKGGDTVKGVEMHVIPNQGAGSASPNERGIAPCQMIADDSTWAVLGVTDFPALLDVDSEPRRGFKGATDMFVIGVRYVRPIDIFACLTPLPPSAANGNGRAQAASSPPSSSASPAVVAPPAK